MKIVYYRDLFLAYLTELNKHAITYDKKYLLTMDSLSSHFSDFEEYKVWRDDPRRTNVIYSDSRTFSNLRLVYFPGNCTAFLQPEDMGVYQFVQHKYRTWLNNCLVLQSYPSKYQMIDKAYELMEKLPSKIILTSFNRSELDCFKLGCFNSLI